MTETDLDIEQIALQVGFNSIHYFDHVFRRTTGLSPRKYRSTKKSKPKR